MNKSAIIVVTRFCLISLGIYLFLSAPWPGVRLAYRNLFIQGASSIYHNFGSRAQVLFEAVENTDEDIKVSMRNMQKFLEGVATIHSGRVGYTTSVLTLSLILATPIAWPRRFRCVLIGLLSAQLFVIGRVGLYLTYAFSQDLPFRVFTPAPFIGSVLKIVYEFLFNSPGGTVIASVIIWLVVTIRSSDIIDILGPSDNPSVPSPNTE